MGLAPLPSTTQPEAQLFRRLIVTNSGYWLKSAQQDPNRVLNETPQVFKSLEYALLWPAAWETARDLLLHLSPLMIRQGHGLAWEGLLCRGIRRSAEEKDPAEIELRLELGNFYRLQGRLFEADQTLETAFDLCNHYWLRKDKPKILNLLALISRLSGDQAKALDYCQQILETKDVALSDRAEALNVMGLVAYDRRQWKQALDCFDQGLTLYRSLDDSYNTARLLTNRGIVLQRSKCFDEAETSYLDAIEQFKSTGDRTEIFKPIMNLGNILLMRKECQAAVLKYNECLLVFQQYNYLIDRANVYNNLGMAYTCLTDWSAAEAYFHASVEIWRDLGDKSYNLANVLDNLGDMFIKAGNLEQAKATLDDALQVLDDSSNGPAETRLRGKIKERLTHLSL